MEEINVYDVSSRKDSLYDKIYEEFSKHFKIKFNEISLEYEIYNINTGVSANSSNIDHPIPI